MTKKDYELIACCIAKRLIREYAIAREGNDTSSAVACLKVLVYDLTEHLRNDNARFDVLRFYLACGFSEQDFMQDYIAE